MRSRLIRCLGCQHVLGAFVAGESFIRHRGREWVGRVYSIRCEKCGSVWTGEQVESERGTSQGDENGIAPSPRR